MADDNEGSGQNASDAVAPGGRSSRGPNPDPGGATDEGEGVPPYAGRTTGRGETDSHEERAASVERQMQGTEGAGDNAEATYDDQYTEDAPTSTPGVRRGEDLAKKESDSDREHEGHDEAGRPVGSSKPSDSTGVDAQENVTDSPTSPAGDQGG